MTATPALIVFDLDFTLWDCGGTWCDCLSPPFRRAGERIVDRRESHIRLYDDVPDVLDACDVLGVELALASRTEQPSWARELIGLLDVAHRFAYQEIYPSSKLRHFAALREQTGIGYDEMLFFDDELRNIIEVSDLGVTCVHVEDGFDREVFEAGLRAFGGRD